MVRDGREDAHMKKKLVIRWQQSSFGDDVGGILVDPYNGEVLYSHISSNIDWLKLDLTTNFPDRRRELNAKYPEGYEVVLEEIL